MAQIQICPRFWLGAAWPQLKAVWPSPSATWPGKIIRVLWEIHMEITWNTSKTIYESLWVEILYCQILPLNDSQMVRNCYCQRVMVISDHGHQAFESWSKLQIRSLPDWVSAMPPHPPGRLCLRWIFGSNQIKWLIYIVCVCVCSCVCVWDKLIWCLGSPFFGEILCPICAPTTLQSYLCACPENETLSTGASEQEVCEHSSSQKMGCADKSWRCKWLTSDATHWRWRNRCWENCSTGVEWSFSSNPDNPDRSAEHGGINRPQRWNHVEPKPTSTHRSQQQRVRSWSRPAAQQIMTNSFRSSKDPPTWSDWWPTNESHIKW